MASEQSSPEPARPRTGLTAWLVAAALAACAVWFAARYYSARFENDQLSQQLALADVALKSARVQLEAEQLVGARLAADYGKSAAAAEAKGTRSSMKVALLTGAPADAPQAIGAATWDPQHEEGVFTAEKLPAIAADQQYELWLIDSKPVSAGVFSVAADGRTTVPFRPTAPVEDVTGFAVSRERNDGRSAHATPGGFVMRSQ